jgi:acetylornithine deacetylase/succinyl-diaminopimelate desuccinylase family protein
MNDVIVRKIESYRDEIIDFTKRLVSVKTENPPGSSYRKCINLIASKLKEIGLDSEVVKVPIVKGKEHWLPSQGKRRCKRYCLTSFHGEGERVLYFHGHYDVVPAVNDDQFRPYVNKSKLYGRGSSDMKGGLASMIYAIKAIKDCDIKLGGKIGLTVVPDEETGGVLGSQYLSQQGVLGKDGLGMLTAEPTGGVIWNANRGAVSLKITIRGIPAHVALQYEGINAFERMITLSNALGRLKKKVEARKTSFKIQPEEARNSILLIGGQCQGGTNFNLVPSECFFTIDRRINPEEDIKVEKKKLLEIFHRAKKRGIDLEVEVLQEGASSGISEESPIAQSLAESVKEITGRIPSFEMCPGLLETRFYTQKRIPAFGYGPGFLEVSHGPDEHIELENIYQCAAVYALTALRTLAAQ